MSDLVTKKSGKLWNRDKKKNSVFLNLDLVVDLRILSIFIRNRSKLSQ